MEIPEPEPGVESDFPRGRARRAVAIIGVALLALGITAVAYLHPSFGLTQRNAVRSIPGASSSYSLAAVDFVDRRQAGSWRTSTTATSRSCAPRTPGIPGRG